MHKGGQKGEQARWYERGGTEQEGAREEDEHRANENEGRATLRTRRLNMRGTEQQTRPTGGPQVRARGNEVTEAVIHGNKTRARNVNEERRMGKRKAGRPKNMHTHPTQKIIPDISRGTRCLGGGVSASSSTPSEYLLTYLLSEVE